MEEDKDAVTATGEQRDAKEAKFNDVVMTLARLLGRQIAREQFERATESGECQEQGSSLNQDQ